jgi:Domain of unknown function (DUF4386)
VAPDQQLEWEARAGRPAAAAAFGSAVFLIAGTIVRQAVALESRPDDDREFLLAIDDQAGAFVVSSVLQSLSFVALGVVLWYLYRATKYRRPNLPALALALTYAGPSLLAVAGVVSDIQRIDLADQFTASGVQAGEAGEKRAEDLTDDRSVVAAALGSGGTLALAFSLVLISLNAMRAGLLSRFLGILGVIVGVLYVLPVFGGPLIVQVFWAGGLGALFLGRWPGGRGPAWDSGEAIPWPSAAEQRARREGAELEERAGADGEETAPEPAASGPNPSARKRKRKRRR